MGTLPKALEYLATLQRAADVPDRYFPVPETFRSKRKLEQYVRSVNPAFASDIDFDRHDLPPGQSLVDYDTLREYKNDLDAVVIKYFPERPGRRFLHRVYFGTVEIPTLDALITLVPATDQYLVILNRGLWEAIQKVSAMLAAALVSNQGGTLNFDLGRANAHIIPICRLIDYLNASRPIPEPPPPLPVGSPPELFWCSLDDSMHCFVFAHEYAHFLCDHFSASASTFPIAVGDITCRGYNTTWINEYQADQMGFVMTLQRLRTAYPRAILSVPRLKTLASKTAAITASQGYLAFLALLCRLERFRSVLFSPQSTHPPTWLRLAAAKENIVRQLGISNDGSASEHHLNPLLHCIEYWFQLIDPPNNTHIPLERRFQDAVFSAALTLAHRDIIRVLAVLERDPSAAFTEPYRGTPRSLPLLHQLRSMLTQAGVSTSSQQARQLISNCAAVIEADDVTRSKVI